MYVAMVGSCVHQALLLQSSEIHDGQPKSFDKIDQKLQWVITTLSIAQRTEISRNVLFHTRRCTKRHLYFIKEVSMFLHWTFTFLHLTHDAYAESQHCDTALFGAFLMSSAAEEKPAPAVRERDQFDFCICSSWALCWLEGACHHWGQIFPT